MESSDIEGKRQEQEESNTSKPSEENFGKSDDDDKSNETELPTIPPLVPAENAVEPDSTVAEIPVNLKVEDPAGNDNNGAVVEEQQQTSNESHEPAAQPTEQERQRSSPPPLTQHVRTITLTPDYRQLQQHQGNNQETAMNEEHQMAEGNNGAATNNATLYVEEGAVDGNNQQETTDNNSYYHHHYTEENGAAQSSVRYREVGDDHKQTSGSVQHTELLDAAAAEAGVPTGYIMMEGEEDDQDDRTSAYIGSRLATFQVTTMTWLTCV